jgi:hypothetical protein
MTPRAFSPGEIALAIGLTVAVQIGLVGLTLVANASAAFAPRPEPPPREVAVAVQPVEELPVLKKGGKPNPKRLPDKVQETKPVPRVEDTVAPTPAADTKAPPPVPKRVTEERKEEPPPDAERAKRVEELIQKMKQDARDPNVPEEGAADGLEEGTESDPLKARAISLYTIQVANWFKRDFVSPLGEVPCDELRGLQARVQAFVGPDRSVTHYTMRPSGNAIFDARVRAAMDARVGQSLPPPPPNYASILLSVVTPIFQGKNEKCK